MFSIFTMQFNTVIPCSMSEAFHSSPLTSSNIPIFSKSTYADNTYIDISHLQTYTDIYTHTNTHLHTNIYIYNTHTHIYIYITCNQNKKLFSTHRKLTSSYFSHVFPMTWRCLCAVRRAPCARWRSWCRAPGNGTAVRWPFWAEGARAMSPRMPGCRGTWGTMEGCFFSSWR
jgi:hypothetical protein